MIASTSAKPPNTLVNEIDERLMVDVIVHLSNSCELITVHEVHHAFDESQKLWRNDPQVATTARHGAQKTPSAGLLIRWIC